VAVRVEDEAGVRLVTIDRPAKRNAIDRHVYRGLGDAFAEAAERDDLGAVVLTGAGSVAFTAGVDLAELAATATGDAGEFGQVAKRFCDSLPHFPKPLIMAVNGLAVGMGTTMLGYADLAFAAESARFRTPFTELGVGAELGSSWLLPHLIGWQRASWLLLSSEWIDARTAADWGLVMEVVPDDELLPRSLAAARTIAARSLPSVLAVKRTMAAWRTETVERAVATEGEEFRDLLRSSFGGSAVPEEAPQRLSRP
jgi:enoyl-CoA hydratase/carnithine racemase